MLLRCNANFAASVAAHYYSNLSQGSTTIAKVSHALMISILTIRKVENHRKPPNLAKVNLCIQQHAFLFFYELVSVKVVIITFLSDQFMMASLFCDFTVPDYQDPIC